MKHAVLSASAAHRWLVCTPSARLEQKLCAGDDTPSESAEEGTVAHRLAEITLRRFTKGITEKCYKSELEKVKNNPFYCEDMRANVAMYTDYVVERYNELRKDDETASLHIETILPLKQYITFGFGHADAVIVAGSYAEVIDLKYGKHVQVNVQDNPQLMLYALGVHGMFDWLNMLDCIGMTIVQPRNGGISTTVKTVAEILSWGESIKPIAEQAYRGDGETVAGEHCRFCGAAPVCRAYAKQGLALSEKECADPRLLAMDEVADRLAMTEQLTAYASKVKTFALGEAMRGVYIKGYKLVRGRGSTHYSDENAIIEVLANCGYEEKEITEPRTLLGITAMKRKLSTKRFDELLSEYIVKTPGKPILVPLDDKRPSIDVSEGFNDLEKEN